MVDLAARFPDDILLRWMKVVSEWDAQGEIGSEEEWVRRLQQAFASELDGVPLDVETVAYWRVLLRTQGPSRDGTLDEDLVPPHRSPPSFAAWFAVLGASAIYWFIMLWGLDEGNELRLPAWLIWAVFLCLLGAAFVFWARRRDVDFSTAESRDTMPPEAVATSSAPDTEVAEPPEDLAARAEQGPMFWKCAECGNTIDEDARVCPYCGVEL
jgi:hypothetical protein